MRQMNYSKDQQVIIEIINKVVGQQVSAIKLGVGSFLTLDFGKLYTETKIYKNGKERTYTWGNWHLWVYMCAWRIDKNGRPYVASSDDRTKIAELIKELAHATLTKCEILNASLDTKWYFDEHITLTLFNTSTEDEDQWFLFTPEEKVLTIGPGDTWIYEPSSSV